MGAWCGGYSPEGLDTSCHLDWETERKEHWTGSLDTGAVLLVPPLNPAWTWTSLFPCLSLNPVISNRAGLCESLGVPSDSDSVTGLFQAGGFPRPRAAPACPGNVS